VSVGGAVFSAAALASIDLTLMTPTRPAQAAAASPADTTLSTPFRRRERMGLAM
jgi:hypothetical protein